MKYLKLFEMVKEKDFDKLSKEIDSISYIMEDENIPVRISFFRNPPFDWFKNARCCTNEPFVEIALQRFEYHDPDYYIEWVDRLQEICSRNGFILKEQYPKHIFQAY